LRSIFVIDDVIELSWKWVIIAASSALFDGATQNKLDFYCAPHIFASTVSLMTNWPGSAKRSR